MFNLANILTAGNLLSGIIAIVLAMVGRIDLAPFAIFLGAFFDFLDGFVARKLKTAGELGKQLDSLADMVTFGVAPGVIMMVILTLDIPRFLENPHYELVHYNFLNYITATINGEYFYVTPFIALAIPFFSLFRLANFNIDTRQTESFIGLPTPANTLFFMTFPLVLAFPSATPNFILPFIEVVFNSNVLAAIIVLVSVMMVVNLPLFSLKFKTFDWKSNAMKYIFLLISIVFILIFKTLSIALIVFLYLILSFIQNTTLKKELK